MAQMEKAPVCNKEPAPSPLFFIIRENKDTQLRPKVHDSDDMK